MEFASYKKFEIVGTSPHLLSDAIVNGIEKALQLEPSTSWFEVVEIRGRIQNKQIDQFQVTLRIGARLE